MVNRLLLWMLLLGLALPVHAQSMTAFVDRTDISINDVFTLTIRIDATLGNTRPPQLAGLNRDFEQVGGVSTRSTYTNNNGNIQSWTEFSIMLRPLTTGTLTIPAFRIGSEVSTPIRINVGEADQTSGNANDEIFLETEVSKSEIYVQEQLLYTIRIYYSIGFDQGAQLTSPQVADAVVQQLGSDENYQRVVNGIGYNVTERRFVIFPQSSGELTIPPVYFSASVGRRSGINRIFSNRGPMREINLTSDAHAIAVLPRPANVPGQDWLPAAELTLEETWSGDLDNVEVGDAITRNITLTANGLSSSLLPAISYAEQPNLKYYPDQPVREDASSKEGIIGTRKEGTAIVASQPGEYVLPEVRLPWWNTQTNRLETAVLPARTLSVIAPADGSAPPSPAPGFVPISGQQTQGGPAMTTAVPTSGLNLFWISSTVIFAAAWLFSTMMWLRSRRQLAQGAVLQHALPAARMPDGGAARSAAAATHSVNASAALRVLQTACNADSLHDIRQALLKWAQASFGQPGLLTLEQVAKRCNSEALTVQLEALDRALYGTDSSSFDSRQLYATVAGLHKHGVSKNDDDTRYALPPLYRQ